MSCLVAREYVLPIRTYHWNSRLQSNRGLIQRFLKFNTYKNPLKSIFSP